MRYLGKTILSGLLLGAATGVLTAGFATKSFATALSYSSLTISNFVVLRSDGSQYTPGDFDVLDVANFTKAESELDGSGSVGSHVSDVSLKCQGDCAGIGQNNFSQQPLPAGHFSRADALLTGSALASGGANSSTVAEIQLNADATATAGSNTGTGTRFSFTPSADGVLTFSFDAESILRTMLTQPDVISFAGVAWSLAIWEGDNASSTIFSFAPACLNQSLSVLDVADLTNTCSQTFVSPQSPLLNAGTTYTLVINHESSARAELRISQPVPEPAALGLLGFGLLGLVCARRSRSV